MPLPPSPDRKELHHRQIDLRVFERADGLYEVEGQVLDTKAHSIRRVLADEDTPPGAPLHDIRVRLVIDADLLVHEVFASSDTTPFAVCKGATQSLAPLKGLRIGPGWNTRVRQLLGGAASCTHMAEMMGPLATAAIQGLSPLHRATRPVPMDAEGRPRKIDSCYAYASHGPVVEMLWPQHHQPAPVPPTATSAPTDAVVVRSRP